MIGIRKRIRKIKKKEFEKLVKHYIDSSQCSHTLFFFKIIEANMRRTRFSEF